jgi:hypothetical protein
MINRAAAWVKPASTGELMRLSTQAKPPRPRAICISPDRMDNQAAKATHSAEPGAARPVNDAATSTQVSAAGPTDRRVEPPNSTASKAGSKAA